MLRVPVEISSMSPSLVSTSLVSGFWTTLFSLRRVESLPHYHSIDYSHKNAEIFELAEKLHLHSL